MPVDNALIMKLRKLTNAGIMDCKKALIETGGDIEKAQKYLREKGILKMLERKDRQTNEGQVYAYIHPGGKLGVMVEIACETDFVAKSDDFQKLIKETALQCAGMKPLYVSVEDVPQDVINEEKEALKKEIDVSKKPPQIVEKILEGKLKKFYEQTVLMEQPYFRDDKMKFKDFFNSLASTFGEAIKITRFVRYEIGQ